MKVELTEQLWDLLNPDMLEDGTAWMFSDDEYFMMVENFGAKEFIYHNPKLEQPIIMVVHPWDKTAGILTVEPDFICLELQSGPRILYDKRENRVIPFKRKTE